MWRHRSTLAESCWPRLGFGVRGVAEAKRFCANEGLLLQKSEERLQIFSRKCEYQHRSDYLARSTLKNLGRKIVGSAPKSRGKSMKE